MTEDAKPRTVSPRKWALLAATSLAAASPLAMPVLSASGVLVATSVEAGEAGEGGESGEAGVARSEGPSAFLTELGYFEGTYLIIANLYLSDQKDLAREHMEVSHHAIYEDIAPKLAALGAPGFDAAARKFNEAVAGGTPDTEVAAALETLLAEVKATGKAANLSLRDQLVSIKDLLALAHAEYEGGVDDGEVEVPIEFRDSWGFYETARHRAERMAADSDPATASAGEAVLEKLAGLDALYPSLTVERAPTDPSPLAAAAGWVEIIALRQD
ncbi:MAG: hypothetical protein ACK5MY_08885 [Jhaorihella sp.]